MSYNYMFGKIITGKYSCLLKTLQGVDDDYELLKGISRADTWPPDAHFCMNENFPENLKLEDFVFNTNNVLVVSERLVTFLDQKRLENNEILPVNIINHKGRIVRKKYFILHQVILQDCLDEEKSEFRRNSIDPRIFSAVTRLVINENRIDPEVSIFRMLKYPSLPLFEKSLVQDIQESGFSGIQFGEITDWQGK